MCAALGGPCATSARAGCIQAPQGQRLRAEEDRDKAKGGKGTDRCATPGGRGMVTVDQVVRILRISKAHVYRLMHSGVLAHTRIRDSDTIAIPADAVRALLAR